MGRFTGEQVGLHGIVHVGEVPCLFAVSENKRLHIFEKRRTELGQYPGIRRTGILARPKDIEIAERHVFQTITPAEGLAVQLANVLGDAVRRDGLRLHGFGFWKSGRLAISRRRSGEDHTFDFQLLGRDQNVERAFDVDLIRFEGVLDRAWHGCPGAQVQNVFRFVHDLPHDLNVRDAAFDESNLVADFCQVVFPAGREVVENDHAMAATHKFVHRV